MTQFSPPIVAVDCDEGEVYPGCFSKLFCRSVLARSVAVVLFVTLLGVLKAAYSCGLSWFWNCTPGSSDVVPCAHPLGYSTEKPKEEQLWHQEKLASGVGVGMVVGDGEGIGVGVSVGAELAFGLGLKLGLGVGLGSGVAVVAVDVIVVDVPGDE